MFFSEIAEGGFVGWTRLKADSGTGAVRLQFPLGEKARVDFGRNVQALNRITALEMQGWMVADFNVSRSGRYLLRCSPAHHVEVDDDLRLLHGDVYSRGFAWSAMTLGPGRHTIYIRVRAKGSAALGCTIRAASDPIEVFQTNMHSPDIVASSLVGSPPMLAMHVLNTGTTWRRLSLRVARSQLPPVAHKSWAKGRSAPRVTDTAKSFTWLAPGQSLIMTAELALVFGDGDVQQTWAELAPGDGDCMMVWVHVVEAQGGEGKEAGLEEIASAEIKTGLRCRQAQQSFVFTFRDHDGSPAHAAAKVGVHALSTCGGSGRFGCRSRWCGRLGWIWLNLDYSLVYACACLCV